MSGQKPQICRTPEEAFQAGWDAPCEHNIPDITQCPKCRLTESEIARIAVLLGPGLRASRERHDAA